MAKNLLKNIPLASKCESSFAEELSALKDENSEVDFDLISSKGYLISRSFGSGFVSETYWDASYDSLHPVYHFEFSGFNEDCNYSLTFIFEAYQGTQSFEISNFNSTLKLAFTYTSSYLILSYGFTSVQQVNILNESLYNITVIKNGSSLYIYDNINNFTLVNISSFFTNIQAQPIIKFGYIFEPQTITINKISSLTFGNPSTSLSSFNWHQLKLGFSTNIVNNTINYDIETNYVFPNTDSIRVLKTIDGYLYAVSKSLYDIRYTTNISDNGSKIFRYDGNIWSDVTGTFENSLIGLSSQYTIVSPNDINSLGGSYFITGLINSLSNRKKNQDFILLGLSTNIIYEEQNTNLTIIYPYNPNPAGTFLNITSSGFPLNIPSQVYFGPNDLAKTISLGVGLTSLTTSTTIFVTDNNITSNVGLTILPILINSIGLNTSTFIGYSNDNVFSTVTLTAAPKTARTYSLLSSNSNLLSTPGIATVNANNLTSVVTLGVGSATSSSVSINMSSFIYSMEMLDIIASSGFIIGAYSQYRVELFT
jgi:hypothetical protein